MNALRSVSECLKLGYKCKRFIEMMAFLPFGGNSKTTGQDFFICGKQNLSDCLHKADIKSLNSAKSLNNLIPAQACV